MKRPVCLRPVVLVGGLLLGLAAGAPHAAGTGDHDPVTGLNAIQRQEALGAHNRWRARVGVPALAWSADLARSAVAWAAQLGQGGACRMQHSEDDAVGENLYWASAVQWSDGRRTMQDVQPAFVVDVWGRESADLDARSGRCRPGRVCGHYTQLVWRDTREVGCAMRVCESLEQVWVCQYRPAGNVAGQRPY